MSVIIMLVPAVCFALIFINFAKKENRDDRTLGANIVIMGDSIFADDRDPTTAIYTGLSERLNCSVLDLSMGGSCMAYQDRRGQLDNSDDAVCMAALTQAVLTNDFRYQKNANIRKSATDYFGDRIETLSNIDFNKVDILIIEHLLNDYQSGMPLKAGFDKYDEYTYEGALRSVLRNLTREYPDLKIVIVSPTESWYEIDGKMYSSSEVDFGGGKITEYLEVQKAVAEEFGLQYISMYELYRDNGTVCGEDGKRLKNWKAYTIDNLHPSFLSIDLIIECLSENIEL